MLNLAPALQALRSIAVRRPRRGFSPSVPPGLDVDEFLALAQISFRRVQQAWDQGDLPALERLVTGPLLAELREQIAGRGAVEYRTDVLELHSRLLAFEELHEAFVASIEFGGLIREQADGGAAPFRELWLLTKLKRDRGEMWQLARVQALA